MIRMKKREKKERGLKAANVSSHSSDVYVALLEEAQAKACYYKINSDLQVAPKNQRKTLSALQTKLPE